ncbi:MAG: hypothetical protein ACT6FC_03370 [Methanosarcinaceae archaeon]
MQIQSDEADRDIKIPKYEAASWIYGYNNDEKKSSLEFTGEKPDEILSNHCVP